jgi:N,N'-diacetyllegionaminate synthase
MNFEKEIKLGNKIISENSAVFIIAEAGVNHGGDMNIARQLIDIAVDAGVDAIKFQAFKTEHLILRNVEKAPYQKKTTLQTESQFDMLKKLEVTKEQNIELREYCKNNNIIFLTTPFDEVSLDEIDELDLPAYKIASTDATNLPFLKKVAQKGKPVFLSTGMTYLSEIEMALETMYPYNKNIVLLQCTANYPICNDEVNLNVLKTFRSFFNILLGYSDHSIGIGAAPYAIPMGVKVVEKHFTIDKSLEGPDHRASLSPDELKDFVKVVRRVESYMGSSIKKPNLSETKTRNSLQKSLVALTLIAKGEVFSTDNIVAKRAGGSGISPIYYGEVFGKTASKAFQIDELISI